MSAADTAAKAAFLAALEIIRAANLFGEGGDISADWPAFRDAMDAAIDAASPGLFEHCGDPYHVVASALFACGPLIDDAKEVHPYCAGSESFLAFGWWLAHREATANLEVTQDFAMTTPLCPYCGARAVLVTGRELYPHRPDLAHLKAWRCAPCGASVGCHDGTTNPKGTLANAETKRARMRAHAAFDPIWKCWRDAYPTHARAPSHVRQAARGRAYCWLAEQLGIPFERCHIGEFDVAMCDRVVSIIQAQRPTAATVRAWWKAREKSAA